MADDCPAETLEVLVAWQCKCLHDQKIFDLALVTLDTHNTGKSSVGLAME